jgi:hypothetical protein
MYSARVVAFVCPFAMFAACVTNPRVEHSPAGIAVDPEVLSAAREVHFDYMKQLALAERGDVDALLALIELSPRIAHSAAGSEQHGDILLAVRKHVGSTVFSQTIHRASPNAQRAATVDLEVAEENERILNSR